jgi:heme-degrading monooxygenase HmoA
MYATIRSYSGSPGLVEMLLEHQSDVRQLLRDIDGFRAYYLVRPSEGEAVTISVFDDQRGGEESTRRAAKWVQENVSDLSDSLPQVTSGEVVLSF